MKNYELIKLENSRYDYLLIATTYENPVNQFLVDDSVPFLKDGRVVFDFTVINGKSSNRYAFADVENHKVIHQTITVSNTVDSDISDISKEFFANHLDIIERSVLPKMWKLALIKEFTSI